MKKYFLFTFICTFFFLKISNAQIVIVTPTDVLCHGESTGSLVVTTTPPVVNAKYTWSPNASVGTISGNIATNLPAGTYSVTVTDTVTQQQVVGSGTINEPDPIIPFGSVNDVTCFGNSDGSIMLNAQGGAGLFTFAWSNGATTPTIQGLPTGAYFVTITDANACTINAQYFVNSPNELTISFTTQNPNCGAADGVINIVVNGGTLPHSFLWSTNDTTASLYGKPAGIYSLTVTDFYGCSTSSSVALNNVSNLSVTPSISDIDCQNSKGSIGITVSGGVQPYTYSWFRDSINIGSGNTIQNLDQGDYEVIINDGAGCVLIKTYTIKNLGINPVFRVKNPVCNTIYGSINLISISGGSQPYTYAWSNGKTTSSVDSLTVGNYSVTITDAQNCTNIQSFTLGYSQYSPNYYAVVSGGSANCTSLGDLTATATNGTPPFIYAWSNGDTTRIAKNLPPGLYSVTVTDANGCSAVGYGSITPYCLNIISGYMFYDSNNNCVKDPGEQPLIGYSVYATNGSQVYYGWTDTLGFYTIEVGAGNFTVSTDNYYGCSQQLSACGSSTVNFSGIGSSANLNFVMTNISTYDLAVWASWTKANPGFNKNYYIYYGNYSGSAFNGTATVTLKYDSVLVYIGSLGATPIHNATAHTLTWTINNIPSNYYTANIPLHAEFNVPVSVSVSSILHTEVSITPTANDCNPINNSLIVDQVVTGSYDPNEKEVYPPGNITNQDSILTYTIHFQNTGNDTTHFVILIDSLPSEIYPSSVTPIAYSHLYRWFSVTGLGGVLKVEFDPIYLVDSATNEQASKGFITFRVKKKPNLTIGTQIKNKAYIYFDYNPPIITNTVVNTIVAPTSIIDIDDKIAVKVSPNPFSDVALVEVAGMEQTFDFELYDVSGRSVRNIQGLNAGKFFIKKEDLSSGIYMYRIITSGKVSAQGRVSVQ